MIVCCICPSRDDEDDQEIEELDRKSKSYKDYVAGETIITINITNVAEGSTHELSAKLSTSVTALLKDYAKQSGILLKSHRFEYKGNMLFATDNRTLQDLNIEQDDTISVTRNETDTESTEDMKEKKGDKGDEEGDANKQVLDVDEWMKGVYAYVIGAEERQMSLKDKAAEKIQKAKVSDYRTRNAVVLASQTYHYQQYFLGKRDAYCCGGEDSKE